MYDPDEWQRLLEQQDDRHTLRIVLAAVLIVAGTAAIFILFAWFV